MTRIELPDGDVTISRDWPAFAKNLSAVLSGMQEDQFLILSDKNSRRYIQLAAQGEYGMRVEVSSNAYLPRHDHFSDRQMVQLVEAGWQPPTGKPEESTPEQDPDGSPNFFIQHVEPIDAAQIANQAVSTLLRILRIPHPGFLTYEASDCDGDALNFPELGLKRTPSDRENNLAAIAERLLGLAREITGINTLDYDEDGDIGFSFGGTNTFIRLVGNPAYVRLYAPLLHDAPESPELLARMNALNANTGHIRFFLADGTVFAVADVPAAPLEFAHLDAAIGRFCEIANGMQAVLEAEFGSRAVGSGAPNSSAIH